MRLEEFDIHTERELLKLDKKDPKTIMNSLLSMGFKVAGKGQFAKVFTKVKGNRVVKVSMKPDTGYNVFLNIAMRNTSNPHLPKVYWKQNFTYIHKEQKRTGFIVVLERLSPIRYTDNFFTTNALQFQVMDYADEKLQLDVDIPFPDFSKEERDQFKQTNPESHQLFNALASLKKAKYAEYLDIHDRNIMYRKSDNSIVITDPFAASYEITN